VGQILSGNTGAIAPSPSTARVTPTHAGNPIDRTTQASALRGALDAPLWGARRKPHPKGVDTLLHFRHFRHFSSPGLAVSPGNRRLCFAKFMGFFNSLLGISPSPAQFLPPRSGNQEVPFQGPTPVSPPNVMFSRISPVFPENALFAT
jgi:hypothetical protein